MHTSPAETNKQTNKNDVARPLCFAWSPAPGVFHSIGVPLPVLLEDTDLDHVPSLETAPRGGVTEPPKRYHDATLYDERDPACEVTSLPLEQDIVPLPYLTLCTLWADDMQNQLANSQNEHDVSARAREPRGRCDGTGV
jgi:hypothetical protein